MYPLGIIQKLDHIVESKIETIYLSPFFKSPLSDMGYDVSNYTAVEPLLGTMQDFERLVDAANQRGGVFNVYLTLKKNKSL